MTSKKFIPGPCPHCGRESFYDEHDKTGWETPCPDEDCPSHGKLAEKTCPIGMPFSQAAGVALEEIERMQAINDEGDDGSDQVRKLLLAAQDCLTEALRIAAGGLSTI